MSREPSRAGLGALTLGAVGVVYGDIGTSPLYTIHEIFGPAGVPLTPGNIVGAVSVIFWGLMLVVTLKYVTLILRADNRGEGGIMALVALAAHAAGRTPRRRAVLLLIGVLGAALFYGDSIITPAISVMGAVEGLEIATPALKPFVLVVSIVVLIVLFVVQRHGTASVGRWFGPALLLWFAVIAGAGVVHILDAPHILHALDPFEGLRFLRERGWHLFAAVGAIVLAFTGAEALYADMGHFGKTPIRLAWTGLVFPALTLNYLGQGALLLKTPSAIENPFYRLFPDAWVVPAVLLATVAAVIASQAVISGAYSMTRQAMLLGFLPRMRVVFTSVAEAGQIYVPQVNWMLLVAVLLAVLGFGSSSAMAAAYGIAVTVTMFITTLLTFFVIRHGWKLPLVVAASATLGFLALDALLVVSCSLKFMDGGWFPLVLGLVIFTVMATWKRGRELLIQHIRQDDADLVPFITSIAGEDMPRPPRTAVYTVANPDTVPQALMHNLKHNMVLHERNVILTVVFHDEPYVPEERRVEVEALAPNFWRVRVNYGFKNSPDIPQALTLCAGHGLQVDLFTVSYFMSREVVVPTRGGGMARWREQLFAAMSRNAGSVVDFFGIPSNAVIELGTRVHL